MVRLRHIAGAICVSVAVASGLALAHFDNMPAFIVLAPGYLVQSWLFERHQALGGVGYQITMIGVATIVWSGILLGPVVVWRIVRRRLKPPLPATRESRTQTQG
jgi:hypothetical protein